MFKDYQNGGSREKTTAELLKKFITTFISITNYSRAPAVFAELEAMVDTDFTLDEFKKNIELNNVEKLNKSMSGKTTLCLIGSAIFTLAIMIGVIGMLGATLNGI
jgi:hypothetical protein